MVIPLILLMWLYRWGLAFAVSGLNGLGSLRGLESGLLTEAQVFPGLIRASVLLGIFTGVVGGLSVIGEIEAQEERALMCAVS